MIVALVCLILIAFIFMGMPVAFALGISGMIGLYLYGGFDTMLNLLTTTPYRSVASNTLATIPLFILMAELLNQGGLARPLFDSARKILGRVPGGVAIATVLSCAGFGAISGSSSAAAGTIAAISVPEFKRLGYSLPIATGVVAVAGTLAVMIPPSIPMVIYGLTTETSIGKLFMAGFIPGILTAILYIIGILVWSRIQPQAFPPGNAFSFREKIQSLRGLWGILLIVALVLFALYGGMATATEIAALGALASLFVLLVSRRIGFSGIITALIRTLRVSTMILTIVFGAMIFGYFLTLTQVTQHLITAITEAGLSKWLILFIVVVIYIIMGCLMDEIAILLITLPLSFPLMMSLGFDPIWFGVIITKLVEIGLVAPPVGLNVFVVSGATGVEATEIFKGTAVFMFIELVSLILLILFPDLVTFLPSLMKS